MKADKQRERERALKVFKFACSLSVSAHSLPSFLCSVRRVAVARDPSASSRPAAAMRVSGPEQFGFSNPTVQKLIQDLPNVDRFV